MATRVQSAGQRYVAAAADDAAHVCARLRESRWTAKASSAGERIEKLERLRAAILAHAHEVNEALAEDLGRPPEQPASLEVGVLLADIGHAIGNVERWMVPVLVSPAPLLPMPEVTGTEMFVQYEGRGVVLIFGAWNQPFMLLLQPLVAAIAAGNVAIVKPHELAPASSRLIATIVREAFDESEVAVLEGGVDLADRLLELPVDHVFFTGSPAVGRKVAAAAARHLASVTLELGGKSPAIVDGTADLRATAAVIAAGKLYNAGQVCISFDHVWIAREARDEFVRHYVQWVADNLYEDGALRQGALTRMVDRRNYDRVVSLVADAEIAGATVIGPRSGVGTDLVIEPMLLVDVPTTSSLMHDEIFGPILPVLAFDDIGEVTAHLRSNEKPLALYAFTTDRAVLDRLLRETSSGGVTVNAWASHAFESSLPFGGIGNSGSGHYRGEFGFRELSHARSVVAFARPFDSVSAVNG